MGKKATILAIDGQRNAIVRIDTDALAKMEGYRDEVQRGVNYTDGDQVDIGLHTKRVRKVRQAAANGMPDRLRDLAVAIETEIEALTPPEDEE